MLFFSFLVTLLLSFFLSAEEIGTRRRAELSLADPSPLNSTHNSGWTSNHPRIRELCDQYGAWLHIDAGSSSPSPSSFPSS